jgi:hypothetical protein
MMETEQEILLKGRLDGSQRVRMGKLLDMLYMPSELAEEVGFTRRQVYRVYIPAGCPHERDSRLHIWINGKKFREWYETTYPRLSLSADEAFCLTCKKPVRLNNPTKQKRGRLVYSVSDCPKCGRKLARIITKEKRQA